MKDMILFLKKNSLNLDGFQYTGGELNFFPHAEGYVNVVLGTTGNRIFNYVYNYTDHLGNIRLSYTKDVVDNKLKILDENHYYPFGLKHQKYTAAGAIGINAINENTARPGYATSTPYAYKYNGKEFQDELGLNMYDMDMRQYDPAIARWVVMDPVIHHSMSPYNSFDNNPVFWADPSGADSVFESGGGNGGGAPSFGPGKGDPGSGFDDSYMNGVSNMRPEQGFASGGPGDPPTTGLAPGSDGTAENPIELEGAVVIGKKDTGMMSTAARAYNNSYNPAYSPYNFDAFSVNFSYGFNFGIINANGTIGLAVAGGDGALILGGDYGIGGPMEKPGFAGGFSGNFHNNYGGNKDVLAGLGGTDAVVSAGLGIKGLYGTSVRSDGSPATQGVETYGIGPGGGFNISTSHSEVFKLSNGIKNVSQGISTFKHAINQAITPPSILRNPY